MLFNLKDKNFLQDFIEFRTTAKQNNQIIQPKNAEAFW